MLVLLSLCSAMLVSSTLAATTRASTYAITGTQGGVQPRLEIRQLQQNADQFNIYLLGLKKMQATDIKNLTSYYQIAGIHGAPFVPWDGTGSCSGCQQTGYCTHGSTLFLPWHRPYLALFEQVLQAKALEAAREFTGDAQKKYVQAATNLRIPYWDWAADPPAGENVFPNVVNQPKVNVIVANGSTVSIANPLYSFDLTKPGYDAIPHWIDSQVSIRSSDCVSAANSQQPQMQNVLFQLLSSVDTFNDFGSFMVSDEQVEDIESLHGQPHNIVGQYMAVVPIAAMDPIFWMHHAMIDRCFALWQAMYPNAWMNNLKQSSGTYTFKSGTTEGPASPLTPFHSDANGNFWTANKARDTKVFNYQYNDATSNQTAINTINKLYSKASLAGPDSDTKHRRAIAAAQVPGLTTDKGAVNQYSVRITSEYGSMGGQSFTVYLFNGPYDASKPTSWSTSPSYVGAKGYLQDQSMFDGMLANKPKVTGSIPLTLKLIDEVGMGKLISATPVEIQAYLAKYLKVAVVKADGTVMPPEQVTGLDLALTQVTVQPAKSASELPKYGKIKTIGSISL